MRRRRSASRRALLAVVGSCAVLVLLSLAFGPRGALFGPRERVLVIGAGAAGLAAAAALSGYASVLILEGQERVGGRMHTNRSLGVPVELSAAWIHRADGNLVMDLAREFGCATYPSENKRLVVYGDSGAQVGAATVTRVYQSLSRTIMPEVLRRRSGLRADGRDDVSLGTLMSRLGSVESLGVGVKRCVLDFLLFRDVVQDHTADLWQTSAARYDTDHYGGRGKDVVLPSGYDCIALGLQRRSGLSVHSPARFDETRSEGDAKRGQPDMRTGIRLAEAGEVTRLRWSEAGVEATLADGTIEQADRAIVTVPLGVLKASIAPAGVGGGREALVFDPPLPQRMVSAIERLGNGEALKVALRFPFVFWPAEAHFLGKIGGGCDGMGSGRHMEFLNVAKFTNGAPVLLMETESTHARTLAAMSDAQVVRYVLVELGRMFGAAAVPAPTGHIVARLGSNRFQRGGFSFLQTGSTHALHTALAEPLAGGRLLLAGEHASSLHAGTVHGAIVSGRRAAASVRAAMRGADAVAAGEAFETEYREKLFALIYNRDEEEEEEWDRNP